MVKNRFRPLQTISSHVARGLAVLLLVFLPLMASMPVGADNCVPPPDPGPGVHHPVGADAAQFTYNCDTGLWASPHYSYDPATGKYTATDPTVYTYNPVTGAYDYTVWFYNAASDQYISVAQSTKTPPAGAQVIGAPHTNTISDTGPNSNNTINNDGGSGGNGINNTGPDSNNTVNSNGNNNTDENNTTDASVTNNLTATGSSGNATVLSNTSAGDATSGDVQDEADIVNMLQSSSNALDGNTVTFVANIDGDVNGDLMIDPSALGAVQPASDGNGNNNLDINNSNDLSIDNNVNLTAKTGDATVSNNTSGGNATSGSAHTIANVVNIINSAITSGKSFIGVININGNFNGNILIPPDFVNTLIAANTPTVAISNSVDTTGPGSSNTINNDHTNNTTVNNDNSEGITNKVNSGAKTGNANVSNNTKAGNATTGKATTTVTAFNLTGSNVVATNDLLVFVNVSGKWVGMILNAPPGATAAELGGGVITAKQGGSGTTTVNNTNKSTINNNINSNSQTGDANVTGNTTGGNATTGDASNAVNLLNVEDSSLSLSNWFGVLFINVFGTWNGNFGVSTFTAPAIGSTTTTPATTPPLVSFAPHGASTGSATTTSSNSATPASISGSLLASHATKARAHGKNSHVSWIAVVLAITAFTAYIGIERVFIDPPNKN